LGWCPSFPAVNKTVMIPPWLSELVQAHWKLKLNQSILKCVLTFCYTCIASHAVTCWLCQNEFLFWWHHLPPTLMLKWVTRVTIIGKVT
jgi:hypothetical protein